MNRKVSLYFKNGASDKQYHVQQDGGTVTFQYGRTGSTLTSGTKCENIDPGKATEVFDKLVKSKKAKGWKSFCSAKRTQMVILL